MRAIFLSFLLFISFAVSAQDPLPEAKPDKPHFPMTPAQQKEFKEKERKRFFFPMDVQTWTLKAKIPGSFFAPSVVDTTTADGNAAYRLYANAPHFDGIASLISDDGLNFNEEPGLRLRSSFVTGDLDCVLSHPWAVAVSGGYRLYYQANAECSRRGDRPMPPQKPGASGGVSKNVEPSYRILSAFSQDGLRFAKEAGVRVDIGAKTNLAQAAHGRTVALPDGTYRLFFSADFLHEKGPTAILGASSTDGVNWVLDQRPLLNEGHDPAALVVDGKILLFISYKMDMMVLESFDGFRFFPKAWIDFEGTGGEIVGDVEVHAVKAADGQHVYLYGHWKGSGGLGVFEQKL